MRGILTLVTMPANPRSVDNATPRIRWYFVAIALLAGTSILGAVLTAATETNTGDGPLIAVLVAVSTLTLVRLALAMMSVRLRLVVPLAFLFGLVASLAMFFSVVRYASGGETDSGALWFPVSLAHLVTVIGYGIVLVYVYRQQRLNAATGRLLFAITYVGIVLTFAHVLFV